MRLTLMKLRQMQLHVYKTDMPEDKDRLRPTVVFGARLSEDETYPIFITRTSMGNVQEVHYKWGWDGIEKPFTVPLYTDDLQRKYYYIANNTADIWGMRIKPDNIPVGTPNWDFAYLPTMVDQYFTIDKQGWSDIYRPLRNDLDTLIDMRQYNLFAPSDRIRYNLWSLEDDVIWNGYRKGGSAYYLTAVPWLEGEYIKVKDEE